MCIAGHLLSADTRTLSLSLFFIVCVKGFILSAVGPHPPVSVPSVCHSVLFLCRPEEGLSGPAVSETPGAARADLISWARVA